MDHNEYSLYNCIHNIPIFQRNGCVEERNINLTISDNGERLRIKLRDLSEYSFNYTEHISLGDFEIIRANQSLDINYNEFKTNIIEMLQQFQKKDMFLKCEISDKKCILIFYTKSKIKNIVYLTLDLHITDQKEIISEMYLEMNELQGTNKKLQKQLSKTKKLIQEKEQDLRDLELAKKYIVEQFFKNLHQIEDLFSSKLSHIQQQVLNEISTFKNQICGLQKKVQILKLENDLKVNSSDRLMKTMENLRLEILEKDEIIQNLKKETASLNILKVNLEKNIADLRNKADSVHNINNDLEKKNVELEEDLRKLSIIVTQKENKISELSKDLVQANNMLVGFNQHYDSKSQQVEELEHALSIQEKLLSEQKSQTSQILKSFEDYKINFNNEKLESLKRDLFLSNKKNGELEEEIRKLNKINALLSQKVSQGYFNTK